MLFTSYARLREVYALLRERLAYPVRLQGELPRAQLLEWFRATPNAVLFATATFWEGIDVVGEALSCVIIDRLPFPSPSDPLVRRACSARGARSRRFRGLHDSGCDGASEARLRAAHSQQADRGLVALLDGRAASTRYGATILSALPPATRIERLDDLAPFFASEEVS